MKTKLLFLFATASLLGQNSTVQLELTGQAGTAFYDSGTMACGSTSTDSGLNAIFANHNVIRYCPAMILSYPAMVSVAGGLVECDACDAASFVSDLEAYSSVVGRARLTPGPETFANQLVAEFNPAILQTGTTAQDIIVTNDPELNSIFETFSVFRFTELASFRELHCDCYAPDLAAALQEAQFIGGFDFQHIVYLSTPDFQETKINVFPNPFRDTFHIINEAPNATYTLYSISGQTIATTASSFAISGYSQSLNSGFYILKVQDSEGIESVFKLVKN